MGANKLPWEDFLRQRALEAAEREKHSKYKVGFEFRLIVENDF